MLTVDASVYINAQNPNEPGSADSLAFLNFVHQHGVPVYSPMLLSVEVAATTARVFNNTAHGIAFAQRLRLFPSYIWVALDETLATEAEQLAASVRLRGMDAIYGAVARRYKTVLVTRDMQQSQRLALLLPVRDPGLALQNIQVSGRP